MKARDIALGGILVALTTIVLYATSILPISTLAILTIASALIPVCIIRSNIQTSIFVYISSSLIAFFLVPINISFIIGFKIMQNILDINIIAGLEVLISKVFNDSGRTIALIILWIVAQPVFLIYDYAMTMIITFYMERIYKNI